MHPFINETDYTGFPVLEIVRGDDNERVDYNLYDIFIQTIATNHSYPDYKNITNVTMVPCSEIKHSQFEEGGIFYNRM